MYILSLMSQNVNSFSKIAVWKVGCVFADFCGRHKNNYRDFQDLLFFFLYNDLKCYFWNLHDKPNNRKNAGKMLSFSALVREKSEFQVCANPVVFIPNSLWKILYPERLNSKFIFHKLFLIKRKVFFI